jgi:hypothetical protein
MKKVSLRINELMNAKNLTINKLAIGTGLTRQTISRLCNNESHHVSLETLTVLLEYFNCDIGDFFKVIEITDID